MANAGSGSRQEPELTAEGIEKLLVCLDQDLNAVNKSKVRQKLKDDIKKRIDALKPLLKDAKASLPDLAAWLAKIQPRFAELTPILVRATDLGACFYQGGCALTTAAQCTCLGGRFDPGRNCDGTPIQ